MRTLAGLLLAVALVAGTTPQDAQACIGVGMCPSGLALEAISCKAEASIDTPTTSTCAGWVAGLEDWDAPRQPVDVSGYVDIGLDDEDLIWTGALGVQVLRDGLLPIWSDVRRVQVYEDDDFTVRNLPSHLLPVLFNRCVTEEPATREFRVSLVGHTRLDHRWLPESRIFTLRIAPDSSVNPPYCG